MPCLDDRCNNPYYERREREHKELTNIFKWLCSKLKRNIKPYKVLLDSSSNTEYLIPVLCGLMKTLTEEQLNDLIIKNKKEVNAGLLLAWWAGHCIADEKRKQNGDC